MLLYKNSYLHGYACMCMCMVCISGIGERVHSMEMNSHEFLFGNAFRKAKDFLSRFHGKGEGSNEIMFLHTSSFVRRMNIYW